MSDDSEDIAELSGAERFHQLEKLDEVIELVSDMLAMRKHKHEIKKVLAEINGGPMIPKYIEQILNKARALLILRSQTTIEAQKQNALAFYETVIRSEDSTYKEKLAAQERLDKIYGLEAVHTGNRDPNTPEELASKAREALKKMRESTDRVEAAQPTS